MTWEAAFDTDDASFLQAVDWFSQRTPIAESEFTRDVEQARRQAFWIAGVTQAEIIRDVHDSLKRALDKGVPFEDWQKEIGPTLKRAWLGQDIAEGRAARTETILRNWAQSSYSRARWQQMDEPVIRRLRPYRMFDAVRDERTSPICGECDGTILPADHPWWDSHRTPMHHRCRSGIRALTERKARALGITEKPTGTDAQEGFGTDEEYKGPDRSKFPAKLKPPKPPKPVPPPGPVLQERGEELAQALGALDGAAARGILREQVQEAFPGAVVRSGNSTELHLQDEYLKRLKAEGVYHWDGRIGITSFVQSRSQEAAGRLARGEYLNPYRLEGIRVLVHEELHGHSRITAAAYDGAARVLEETGTEIAARRIISRLLKRSAADEAVSDGAYQHYIQAVTGIISHHTGDTQIQAIERILGAHRAQVLGGGEPFSGPSQYEEAWADGLGVTSAQRRAILRELRAYALANPP